MDGVLIAPTSPFTQARCKWSHLALEFRISSVPLAPLKLELCEKFVVFLSTIRLSVDLARDLYFDTLHTALNYLLQFADAKETKLLIN